MADERPREERVERIYDGWSAWAMAEKFVELEEEVEAAASVESDRLASLEARDAEIERLKRDLRLSEAKVGGAALYVDRVNARVVMLENVVDAYDGIHGERDRYRLAWLSARRRAADEANFGAEALALRDEEITRLRGSQKEA
ncbi:hypothetical protein [Streptomyces silvensis]|uniref:Uncharacterized protein n=1 Tax=Streptomyces silvensis TaxID=1765722 RepID=A0A0W7X7X7_9ACTN|nr:hypothetical protein [Streptomyces silvensis]KUF18842.1 hypothetical protein AT728_07350 [Streptomyces silvensis]